MEDKIIKGIMEAILFASGNAVDIHQIQLVLEKSKDEIEEIITEMNEEYAKECRGLEIIKVGESYQLASRKEFYEHIYKIIDNRNKPKLSNAALETLAIIAYNQKISRAEIESIRRSEFRSELYINY